MNAKRCVYKNCGNTSALSPKTTFFSFPLKDLDKCLTWAELAGVDDPNLKHKFLCENHFSTVYISKTPRRTVLLPNALPFQYTDNINTDEHFEEDYNSEKNALRDEIMMENLEEEHEIIYNDTIEVVHHKEDIADVENIEALEEPIIEEESNVKPSVKLSPVKIAPKTYNQPVQERVKTLDTITNKRTSFTDLIHVTKRQKMHTSADNIDVKNETIKTNEKHAAPVAQAIETQNDQLDNTSNNPDITTFIYKGEEYIQMPKRIYLQQRAKLDADVKRFQTMVQSIQNTVNSFK